jgi:hypothetical protein
MAKSISKMTAGNDTIGTLPINLPAIAKGKHGHARNPGTALNTDWLEGININFSAVERRTSTLLAAAPLKKNIRPPGF